MVVMQAVNVALAWSLQDDARDKVDNQLSCLEHGRLQRDCTADITATDGSACRAKWKVRAYMRNGRVVVTSKMTENTCTGAWS